MMQDTSRFTPCHPRRLAGLLSVVGLALLTANCSQAPRSGGIDPKYGVAASPRVVAEGNAVPKGGGREMVGKPYVVAGKTYVPRENPNYVGEGLASWYGDAFHGRLTANGEVFDKHSIAAAHPTMPLPSYVRVTNIRNKRSMIVRVNDRGPFHGGRVIDLSQKAAEALDFKHIGLARVKVEYMGRASTKGSDDRKLMATLRMDGAPATFPGVTAPATMVASAEPVAVRGTAAAAAPVLAANVPLPPERPFDLAFVPDAPARPAATRVAGLFFAPADAGPAASFAAAKPFAGLRAQTFAVSR